MISPTNFQTISPMIYPMIFPTICHMIYLTLSSTTCPIISSKLFYVRSYALMQLEL